MFLKLFLNAMIRNIKIHNIFILLKFQNLWNLINVLIRKKYENIYLNVSHDFSKFDGSMQESQGNPSGTTQGYVKILH
jgi:hypothetical protein